jgi:hypothetical protein
LVGCITSYSYNANSYAEALLCARRDFGDDVATDPLGEYDFALYGIVCSNVTVTAENESDAQSCAWSLCVDSPEPQPRKCP